MTEATQVKSLAFRAEIQQLLHILAHSLYTDREIFLRELISNASDALHRVRFEMLTNQDVLDPEAELAIHLSFDEGAKTITVSDSGIGMNREELVENLGTIAQSGARTFLQSLEEAERPSDVIGQFGVGFYSVFMVAQEVRVTSRSFRPEDQAWTWRSQGENTFTVEAAEKSERGTTIEIQLKDDAVEFAQGYRLEQIVKKHSDFVAYPIYLDAKVDGERQSRVINQQTALWRQSPQEVTDEQYNDFYRQLTLDFQAPLLHMHLATDAPVQTFAILYVPRKRERGVLSLRTDHGLKLYSRKVLIQEYNKDLLPGYLRFVEGVVDSEDLPLNVSRESVQTNLLMSRIGRILRRRLISALETMAEERPEDYATFWREFGAFVKEGVAAEPVSRDELLNLLRFHSSRDGESLVSLAEYVERMGEAQESIYYILGQDLTSVANSPHLDYFEAHDIEVLYLVDPIDSFMVMSLREFEDKPLRNVDDADLDLPAGEAPPETEEDIQGDELARLIQRFERVLGDRVVEVRESTLLTDSPCRLVSPGDAPDRDMQRVQRLLNQSFEVPKKIIELNRRHPLIRNLAHLVEDQPQEALIDMAIEQLYDSALLMEGLHPNPATMVPRVQQLMEQAAASLREANNKAS
jgi:molecular chaperone HtpG